jgi:hypothetical protein
MDPVSLGSATELPLLLPPTNANMRQNTGASNQEHRVLTRRLADKQRMAANAEEQLLAHGDVKNSGRLFKHQLTGPIAF